jgi:hypothetical protein
MECVDADLVLRQVNGTVIAIFGLFGLGLGAEGIAKLVS